MFLSRVILSASVATILLCVVIARLVQLQVLDYETFAERAQGNRIRIEAVPPIRGLIFDRDGRLLAENLPAYQLELIPEQVADIDNTLFRLAGIGLIRAEDVYDLSVRAREGLRFRPVTLNERLSDVEIANFAVQRPRFPGVDVNPRLIRHYPYGEATAHVVGYVGALSLDDMQNVDAGRYAGTTRIGKTGVESSVESNLHGASGLRHFVTNARGRQLPSDDSGDAEALPANQAAAPGNNVYLTIDLDLQQAALRGLEGRRGAVVALDPWSGEVLAMISAPGFDPNLFATGMSSRQFRDLQRDPDRPLFNRAIRGTYPPGSTIKPMLALAALEVGATNLTRKTLCYGFFSLPNSSHRYRDWKPEGHGPVDLHDAIAQSCDVYFYEISNEIGIDRMHDYLDRFGLGATTGVDIGGEAAGLVPSREWKRRNFSERPDQVWFPGETVIASIGQGYMSATPLQLASAVAAVATRGIRYQPHVVAAFEDPLTGERELLQPQRADEVEISNEFYWDNVIAAMHDVMQHPRGTAYMTGSQADYMVAGKSGTAQVFSVAQEDEYDEEEIAERLRDHALFVAFAPVDDPQIAVAVIVENGSSGSRVAAPIAKAVIDAHLGVDDAAE